MWDGLLDILKQVIAPLIEALKELFCWVLEVFFSVLTFMFNLIISIFPNWPVPEFIQSGLESISVFANALNWVLPLGFIGPMFAIMFSIFTIFYIIVPFYRGVMDLL